jgi:hypothetical protein
MMVVHGVNDEEGSNNHYSNHEGSEKTGYSACYQVTSAYANYCTVRPSIHSQRLSLQDFCINDSIYSCMLFEKYHRLSIKLTKRTSFINLEEKHLTLLNVELCKFNKFGRYPLTVN